MRLCLSKKFIIVTDRACVIPPHCDCLILRPEEFIRDEGLGKSSKRTRAHTRVINLCANFDYLSKGYYVSLLAEARGMPCLPQVSNIVTLNWKRNYEFTLAELNALLQKSFHDPAQEPLFRTYTTYFGRHENPQLEPLTRKLFDLFRFPLIKFCIKYQNNGEWGISRIYNGSIAGISGLSLEHFQSALDKFTGSAWSSGVNIKKNGKYWLAILHDPQEKFPPSNKGALSKFVKLGKQVGFWVELVTKQDFSSLIEYDALFIRETTAINNHTYRFAAKAQQEGIVCVDDMQSILRCCNKVFLHELLQSHKVPTPKTIIIDRRMKAPSFQEMSFPLVLKIPDGSFSRGVHKAKTFEEFQIISAELLKKSEIILCQEFVESEFDWRIGVLGGEVLYASQYYMAQGHWQIYNHGANQKSMKIGKHQSMDLDKVPQRVLITALQAAKLIGNGLYGVDLKEKRNGQVVVIEVNDNPNIDSGVEDLILGDQLYRKILEYFMKMVRA